MQFSKKPLLTNIFLIMNQKILLLLCLILPFGAFAQNGSVSGQVFDGETNEPLIGATVLVQGTSTGSVTDLEGRFSLGNLPSGDVTLSINYIGYTEVRKDVTIGAGTVDLGVVSLQSSAVGLNEVMVIASVGVDRKTPVAMSNIKAAQIEAKIGNQEFPEILKSTPGVYATKAGGGFGDGRINIRGFDSENVAVLINGVPVNDMENGRVYWSNWAGLTDATNTMQVQRGLGASKVAVPSVGGTINIISKASEREKGGSFNLGTGNDAYSKVGFEISTGLSENGWAMTMAGSRTQGDGFVDGTEFLGYSYFASIAKKINDNHELSFTAIGAQQRHGQRQSMQLLETFRTSASGIKYNGDWGYKNGQVLHAEDNFYHKPQISLNHYWTINDKMELSTAVYASFGTGGGGGTAGSPLPRKDGVIDFDTVVDQNDANGEAISYLRASRNDHKWYGALSTLNYNLNDNLSLMGGLDVRYYRGDHFSEVTDLLGAEYAVDNADINNPNNVIRVGDKRDYHNLGDVLWGGLFAQAEYSLDKLSAFVTVNAFNNQYKRTDYFNYLDSDPNQETEWVSFTGFGAKGGANYNLTDNHNVFVNGGYFEKAPFFNATFLNFANDINEDAENQKIFSYEVGYGYRSSRLTLNINAYRTEWKDRTLVRSVTEGGIQYTANLLGVDAVHQGVEIDAKYNPFKGLEITGMLSLGDYKWKNDLKDVNIFDESQNVVSTVNLYIADLKVGDAAQTTAALGVKYDLLKDLSLGVDYNYYADYYAQFDPSDRGDESEAGLDAWKLPAWGLFDVNLTYKFQLAGLDTSLYGNVYNVTDTQYISDANDGDNHDALTSVGYYGMGRNWNLTMRINF